MAEEERLRFPHGHRPRLRVKEQDGDPTVEGVREIRVSNATLTDEGKGVVSIVTGAGGGAMATDPLWDALGDLAYGTGADTGAKLAGQTTVVKLVLTQTGNGAISAAPVWGHPNAIWDADADTGIQVEEAADEDVIRFDIAGVGNLMTLQAAGLNLIAHSALGAAASLDVLKVCNIKEIRTVDSSISYGLVVDYTYYATTGTNVNMFGCDLYARYKGRTAGNCSIVAGLRFAASYESARPLAMAYGVLGYLNSEVAGTGTWTEAVAFCAMSSLGGSAPATITGYLVDAGLAALVTTAYGFKCPDLANDPDLSAPSIYGFDIDYFTIPSANRIGIRNASPYVATPSAAQTLLAATTILANAEDIQITAAAARTMTSTPTIADGADGQIVTIINVGATYAITLQDQGTLAGSNLRLSAATIALGPRDSIVLKYNATIGDWVQIGQTNVI